MKLIISFLLIAVVALSYADKYTSKYDDVDIDQILQSERLLRNYLNCLLDKGRCTPDGAELKSKSDYIIAHQKTYDLFTLENLPDALENECSKCNESQKKGASKVIRYLIDNKRQYWDELAAKYDPEGVYLKKYEAEAKKENINL